MRSRYVILPIAIALAALSALSLYLGREKYALRRPAEEPEKSKQPKKGPKYKHIKHHPPAQIPEYFPLAAKAKSSADLPPIPLWNTPPGEHIPEKTPLYIGFTRNWPMLQQVVVSYITAGWPPEDIYVVENTGTMDANKHGRLTVQNPFYLDYHRLTKLFGVNVVTTPSLQSFAQLQTFYLSEAINNNLSYYFWGHMDVVTQAWEDREPYKSLYMRAVDTIRETQVPGYRKDEQGREGRWAIQFFSYDWLALVNVAAFVEVGGWDTMVSYYGTDCDMYARLSMAGFHMPIADAGKIYDVARSLDDLEILYRRRPRTPTEKIGGNSSDNSTANSARLRRYADDTIEDDRGGKGWESLQETLAGMEKSKAEDKSRNSWQVKQSGGEGEPYYRDPDGFETALQWTIETGMKINEEKWGHKGCDIGTLGLKLEDQWKVEHDEYVFMYFFRWTRSGGENRYG